MVHLFEKAMNLLQSQNSGITLGNCLMRVQDIALLNCLRIQNLSPRRFGYEWEEGDNQPVPYSHGFRTERDRKRAFEMYADFLRK